MIKILMATLTPTLMAMLVLLVASEAFASTDHEAPMPRHYAPMVAAPKSQSLAAVQEKSRGCQSCHTQTDSASMHASEAVMLGCTDCHGGDASIFSQTKPGSTQYKQLTERAHVLPLYPKDWNYPSSANPQISYTLLNREAPQYVRFVNPSDLRVAQYSCGACHTSIIQAAKRSLMATGAMLFGAASYANNVLPYKKYILGEAYSQTGEANSIVGPPLRLPAEAWRKHGVLSELYPIPAWETVPPGDIFRVFERGGKNISNLFPETGLPDSLGKLERISEPGRPDIRQSNRGPGTGLRISVPVLNVHKTRLNDPLMWFLGTNDHPGDYRTSGCGACHVAYANDRDPQHSGPWAKYGNLGKSATVDPTIPKDESGHPIKHKFTTAIPTAQCMSCHMHQPNMFLNTYMGYTMWDYESDAPFMFPKKQRYPTADETRKINAHDPEGAAVRGLWSDPGFLANVSDLNKKLKNTQFADYHGHGWVFRGVFKKDRKGNLLDKNGKIIPPSDPNKFTKAVHLSSIHMDKGMNCVDCHFANDSHGNGYIYGEVADAVEIDCVDCHGTVDKYPTLDTSGPAAPPGGTKLGLLRNPDGKLRFFWRDGKLYQRSILWPDRTWRIKLVKDTVNPESPDYNPKAARAKLMSEDTKTQHWGEDVSPTMRAHSSSKMECYTCHQAWTTSCGGCHLPSQANWKTPSLHYKGSSSRNFATYNPQVVRDQIFMLGHRGPINGGRIAPIRSTSALVLSSTNAKREHVYTQQPPISASGYSSQAMNPHFAHTVRTEETQVCSDCHLSADNNNNAIMAQTLGYGTDFIDFIGYHAYMGTAGAIDAVQVTEWSEPQAVIGSYLQKYVYPDYFKQHQENKLNLKHAVHHDSPGPVGCLQLRGEYLFAATGAGGMVAYDVASVSNKGVSEKIITAPFSPLGDNTRVKSKDATCLAFATTQPVAPERNKGALMRDVNQEKAMHPIYKYLLVTDAKEGLILINPDTLKDRDPRNNFLKRALTWNKDGLLDGARYLTIGGHYVYIIADKGLVVLDLSQPTKPRYVTSVPLNGGRSVFQQFRYLFVTDKDGLRTIDITDPAHPVLTHTLIPIRDAHRVFVARTYAYVAAGHDGLYIVDATRPDQLKLYMKFNDGIVDARDVVVASTNVSLFAYVADGTGGLKVIQLMSPSSQPRYFGFSPDPEPQLIARYKTRRPALSLSHGLERDRAVDESGDQVTVFSRIGSGPLTDSDMHSLYLDKTGKPWFVHDSVPATRDAQKQEKQEEAAP